MYFSANAKTMLIFVVFLNLCLIYDIQATSISDVIHLACQRNPSLSLCQNSSSIPGNLNRTHDTARNFAAPTEQDIRPFDVELLKALLDRLHKEDEHGREGDLREHTKTTDNEEEFEKVDWTESRDKNTGRGDVFGDFDDSHDHSPDHDAKKSQTQVETYCNTYQENYAFYCLGGIVEKTKQLKEHLRKFCPSYELNCPAKVAKYSRFDRLEKIQEAKEGSTGQQPNPFPNVAAIAEETESPELNALKKQHPCTPNCDQRIWKHCTQECKCDYLYPYVQRFCNPPPIPFFLNTCRLWYYSCPKYERYHYASQFVYSKAEKGKVLPGTPVGSRWPSGVAPYSINSGAQPVQIFPTSSIDSAGNQATQSTSSQSTDPVAADNEGPTHPFKNPFLQKDFIENSEQRNAISRQILENKQRAKAFQATSFPVVPSDSAFAAGGTGSGTPAGDVHQFDAYTDRRGLLHRPRSRSPFTKPGLWEPNPDDPHNRDHANKWYYEPKSVGVDWLNGQATWGGHWAVPAAGVGGTNGYSAIFFPTIGNFLNIADDYD